MGKESESNELAPILVVTDAAARKVYTLIQEENEPSLVLRVFITGGGCSGFQYGFSFEEQVNEDDTVVEKRDFLPLSGDSTADATADAAPTGVVVPVDTAAAPVVRVVVDMMSLQYLQGAEIDYREDINGAQFIIRNPNAKTTCGCGQSFAAKE